MFPGYTHRPFKIRDAILLQHVNSTVDQGVPRLVSPTDFKPGYPGLLLFKSLGTVGGRETPRHSVISRFDLRLYVGRNSRIGFRKKSAKGRLLLHGRSRAQHFADEVKEGFLISGPRSVVA